MASQAAISVLRAAVVAVGLAGVGAGLLAAQGESASRPAAAPPWKRIGEPSVVTCGGCHIEVTREWSASLHAKAWTNQNVRVATKDFSMPGCRACHSPMPMLATGLEERPAFRDYNHEDGVHCLSCHGLDDGVAAARTIEDAPCKPRREPKLLDVASCYPCHQPTHQAYDEYYTSKAFREGRKCADCHMPARADGKGRSHGPHGGLNREFVRKAIEASFAATAEEVKVTVTNRTGHKFPGEIPSRSFVLRFEEGERREYISLRRPNKGESIPDPRLTPDETRVLTFRRTAATAPATVRLLFKPFPLTPDDEAMELAVWSAK